MDFRIYINLTNVKVFMEKGTSIWKKNSHKPVGKPVVTDDACAISQFLPQFPYVVDVR